jgi:anthranilate phosphoribosyltransferase
MEIKQALARIAENSDLTRDEMQSIMEQIMSGQASDAQIGALLMGLRMKGETVEEITAAAGVMRSLALPVSIEHSNAVDIVGTGGDGANLFNVSSASAFVVAAAGGVVAKHGNRSVSSSSGAADVLEAAGLNLEITPEQIAACIEQVGVGFMFAPQHHLAMKHAIGPRRDMGMRTLFNVLGPLTNPAGVKHYLLGVFDASLCLPLAKALQNLGAQHAMVVHASDGLDEITLSGKTHVAELQSGVIKEYELTPEDVGLETTSLDGLQVGSAQESLALIKSAFAGESPKAQAMIALNAGAALYVADEVATLQAGVEKALAVMNNGKAAEKVAELARVSQGMN